MGCLEDHPKCNLCGEAKAKFLFKKEGSSIFKCEGCGLVFRHFALKDRQAGALFRNSPFIRESEDEFVREREHLFRYLLKEVNKYAKKGKLLDLGCQFGHFIALAREDGWDVFGIEVAKKAVAFAKDKLNLNIFEGTLEEARFPDNFFDLVTLWDVLYHLPKPAKELREIHRILKPGGMVGLRLENVDFHLAAHYLHRFFVSFFRILKIEDVTNFHMYEFSPRTIKKTLKRAGFRGITVKNSLLTHGDLYRSFVSLPPAVIKVFKKLLSISASLLYHSSGRKIVFSSSMLVTAKK